MNSTLLHCLFEFRTYTTILEEELNLLIMQKLFLLDKINNIIL